MTRERKREMLSEPLTAEYLAQKANEGWRPVAVEWQRDSGMSVDQEGRALIEVPFGLEVVPGAGYLRECDAEMAVLRRILAQIVEDRPLSEIAAFLNDEGFGRRGDLPWTQSALFELLPRVIEMAPSIYSSEAWQVEQRRFHRKAI